MNKKIGWLCLGAKLIFRVTILVLNVNYVTNVTCLNISRLHRCRENEIFISSFPYLILLLTQRDVLWNNTFPEKIYVYKNPWEIAEINFQPGIVIENPISFNWHCFCGRNVNYEHHLLWLKLQGRWLKTELKKNKRILF